MHEYSLDSYYNAMDRINTIIGNAETSIVNTVDNLSRDRLFRVQKGLLHLLTEIIPQIEDEQKKTEIHYWIDSIYIITRCQEWDFNKGTSYV
ncbi:transcriptional regulator [Limnobaculum zhutongyuii]|uniref:Transcriptional regulator n=1 Tax=Limnobaculum zhutongyuii TaxID=2498113 RepID=A0A411WQC6_9GAMM|nr:transcriptional regulator [Limnobaculum zhutongyuii]QBH98439.1 transcriptional regulator [Limnobaculum zhutongyuii]TQS89663.1 transcriptional regulator [Limnobaculum zhutongyuii]